VQTLVIIAKTGQSESARVSAAQAILIAAMVGQAKLFRRRSAWLIRSPL
jgi:hypothetical protein